jgi:hypothetical protein
LLYKSRNDPTDSLSPPSWCLRWCRSCWGFRLWWLYRWPYFWTASLCPSQCRPIEKDRRVFMLYETYHIPIRIITNNAHFEYLKGNITRIYASNQAIAFYTVEKKLFQAILMSTFFSPFFSKFMWDHISYIPDCN